MKHVFIIGSKGIPAAYGGFETFVENLTGQAVSEDIQYHVACMSDHNEEFTYHNAKSDQREPCIMIWQHFVTAFRK